MRTSRKCVWLALFLAGAAFAPLAEAVTLVVDQSQTHVNYGFFVTSPATYPELMPRWQAFRPNYNNIEKVDLFIADDHRTDSILTVWITDSMGATLWTAGFPTTATPTYGWLQIDTPTLAVTPGVTYRLNATVNKYPNDGNPAASVYWQGSTTPTAYFENDTSLDWPTFSYAFRTYAVVPEPSTLALFVIGILAWVYRLRR